MVLKRDELTMQLKKERARAYLGLIKKQEIRKLKTTIRLDGHHSELIATLIAIFDELHITQWSHEPLVHV